MTVDLSERRSEHDQTDEAAVRLWLAEVAAAVDRTGAVAARPKAPKVRTARPHRAAR